MKNMENTFKNMTLFLNDYDLSINEFYSITFDNYGFKFQGNFNSMLLQKLEDKNLKFIIKNTYVQTKITYLLLDVSIVLI